MALEPKFYTAAARYAARLARQSGEGRDPAAVALRARAKAVADAAVRLRPDGGEAYLSEALAAAPTDKVAAEAMYQKALAAPRPSGYGWEHQYYSRFLLRVGRLQDAGSQSQMFLAVVGTQVIDAANILWAQAVRGEYGAAEAGFAELAGVGRDAWAVQSQRLRIALWARDWATARDALEWEPDGLERRALAGLIEALASAEPAHIHAAGEPFLELAADPATVSPLAIDALALSGHDAAVTPALARMIEANPDTGMPLMSEPILDAVRRTPAFEALAAPPGPRRLLGAVRAIRRTSAPSTPRRFAPACAGSDGAPRSRPSARGRKRT